MNTLLAIKIIGGADNVLTAEPCRSGASDRDGGEAPRSSTRAGGAFSAHEFVAEGGVGPEGLPLGAVEAGAFGEQAREGEALVFSQQLEAHLEDVLEVAVPHLELAQRGHDDVHGVGG